MLLTASRRAQVLQEASCELEKNAILKKLIGRLAGGASKTKMMPVPKTLTSAQRTALIAEPVMPAASTARRQMRLAAQKGARTSPVPSRAAGGATVPASAGARPAASAGAGTVAGKVPSTRAVPPGGPGGQAGPSMSRTEQLAGAPIAVPAAELGIEAATRVPSLLRRAALPTGLVAGAGGAGYAVSEEGLPKAAALSSLGPEKLAALALALGKKKQAFLGIGKLLGTAAKAAPTATKVTPTVIKKGLGLKGGATLLGAGALAGGAGVLGTQGALKGRSAQYVGPAPGVR